MTFKVSILSMYFISCVLSGNVFASHFQTIEEAELEEAELEEAIRISLMLDQENEIQRVLDMSISEYELELNNGIMLDAAVVESLHDYGVALDRAEEEARIAECHRISQADAALAEALQNEEYVAYGNASEPVKNFNQEKAILEKEITDQDYFEFGEIYKILVKKRDEEMSELEPLVYNDHILHFADNFQYGVEEAAEALGMSQEAAQSLNNRIEERQATLKEMVTNPADKETYIAAYREKYKVSQDFAERVYNQMM